MHDGGSKSNGSVKGAMQLNLILVLSALLLVSAGWNVWFYAREQTRRAQAVAEERASQARIALAKEQAARVQLKRQAKEAETSARVQQLYDEINKLSHVGENMSLLGRKNAARSAKATPDEDESAALPEEAQKP
jgi:hypothetical protein